MSSPSAPSRASCTGGPPADDDAYGARQPVRAARRRRRPGADARRAARHADPAAPRGGDRAAPGKRTVTFEIPVAVAGGIEQRTYTDIDTSRGAYLYERLGLPGDEFEAIAGAALEAGIGLTGFVGEATCHLFPAPELVRFGAAWIDDRFI